MKKRLLATLVAMVMITVCVVISQKTGIHPPVLNIVGAYASAIAIVVITYKFSFSFFVWVLCFDFFATAFGSVLNFYRTIDSYDRMIHFMSGLLLAEAGRVLVMHLLKRFHGEKCMGVVLLFAACFSFAGAGLWEIYEFTADQLIQTNMQGNNLNTMGDIVSGFLGGLTYVAVYGCKVFFHKKNAKTQKK